MPHDEVDNNALIESALEEKLGINRQRFIRHVRLVKLMAWEQVFLAAYYARFECMVSRSCVHFTDRLRLLILARQHNNDLFMDIGRWLDEGLGFLALSERMKSEEFKGVESFLASCEEEQIVFPALKHKALYPHITLLAALENIMEVFETLLEGSPPEQLCDNIVLALINKQYPLILDRSAGISARINSQRTARFSSLSEALSTIPVDRPLGLTIQQAMDKHLAKWMTKAFNRLRCPSFALQGDNESAIHPRERIACFSQNVNDNEISITFNREHLVRCMALGQGHTVMNSIQDEISDFIGQNVFKSPSHFTPDSLHSTLSAWHRGCGVLGLKNEKSIPAKVATLLDFDIQHAHWPLVFIHPYIKHLELPYKVSLPDSAQITTTLIDRCLLHTEEMGQRLRVEFDYTWDEAVKSITTQRDIYSDDRPLIGEAAEENREPGEEVPAELPMRRRDRLMETWSDGEPSKVAERFKRPRKKVWGDINGVEQLVNEQKKQAMGYRYPVEGPFPLPLWC